ncbi:M23 family metallopeptidase [Brunnivagina elsteri]|uniref:Peptidase M23 n=1 Tax=Brunnivagina elsteri CCALA 953 TaxID=987040 RepID=A0A2A2TK87_9CYAN|nr:M23 family metallopeptidase [Calothrix elsteri]PAX56163.1 peptidase M23 [Calothrix elsteri CCALA 953]
MTQRKNSARKDSNPSSNQSSNQLWQRSLPAQSICWLSSLSIIWSSGLVLAQTESAIDNIVPTAGTAPTRVENFVPKATSDKRSNSSGESPQVEFSARRTRLRQRLQRNVASQSSEPIRRLRQSKKNTQEATVPVVRNLRPKVAQSRRNPVVIPETRVEKKQVEVTSQPTAPIREEKPQNQPQVEIKAPVATIAPSKLPTLAQPNKPINIDESTADKPKDYNNAYIDPSDYSTANGNRNESPSNAPSNVILTERSSGCRSILGRGQNVSGNCVKAPVNAKLAEHLATSKGSITTAPSWIRKSHSIDVANILPTRRIAATTESNSGWKGSRIAAASRVAVVDVTRNQNRIRTSAVVPSSNKNTYNSNRFIPAPSSFIPQQTMVSGNAIAPSAGTLPLPMTDANVAPRPSTVAYNIPLESTLPRVTYTGGFAYNPTGFIFPLSVPSPITSIFGWRTHPISGDRRFHSGADIGAAMGTPVLAAYTGQIEVADSVGGYGLTVIVNHNSAVQTLYGHMSQIYVQPGQWVQQGTVIGLVGSTGNSTGPHLHFEVRQLTANGWVATDPGVHLQYALGQLMQSIQTAQLPQVPNN